jgi:hypothetical protein
MLGANGDSAGSDSVTKTDSKIGTVVLITCEACVIVSPDQVLQDVTHVILYPHWLRSSHQMTNIHPSARPRDTHCFDAFPRAVFFVVVFSR